MAEISRGDLFGKLTQVAFKSLESATTFCKLRGNPNVELAHWLFQILQLQDSDLVRILRSFHLSEAKVAADLTASLDRLPKLQSGAGQGAISDLSTQIDESVERGWIYASLLYKDSRIRTGYLLIGILKTPSLRKHLVSISSEFGKVDAEALSDDFRDRLSSSVEASESDPARQPGSSMPEDYPAELGCTQALSAYTNDLTAAARDGKLDPVIGREPEIRQVVNTLMRRRQNNPILTGEAGVGKTAIVEGLALRLATDDVPPALKNVRLLSLDVGLLKAGASVKGELEQRLRQVMDEVQASTKPVILFIDEAHVLLGEGPQGSTEAGNLLKPALARGSLRTIAATTWSEYKRHIEKDPAMTRRFQVVKVEQPDLESATHMLRPLIPVLAKHHGVAILDEALRAAVELSDRYVPDRQLPDKAVSLLDTAAARVSVSQHAVPAKIEDFRRRIGSLESEVATMRDESAKLGGSGKDVDTVDQRLLETRTELESLENRWQEEIDLVRCILQIRSEIGQSSETAVKPVLENAQTNHRTITCTNPQTTGESERGSSPELLTDSPRESNDYGLTDQLLELQAQLQSIQGEEPLVLAQVDAQAIAETVADWTGVPVGRMVATEIEAVLKLEESLSQRVVGQDHVLEPLTRRIQTSRAQLDDPEKPVGVFLLAGPSGVGKTETAIALAETFYGGRQNLITINMSEFQEAHTVSTLKGAPPGYVGYGEGGVLTEAVRRKPYCVLLLDEIEKAHPDTHEVFFQVFDKGRMDDGEGRSIDFKNTIILMTSNVGSDTLVQATHASQHPSVSSLVDSIRPELLQVFPAALLGRMVVLPYLPLGNVQLLRIIELKVQKFRQRVQDVYGAELVIAREVLDLVRRRCTQIESGGRMIDAILTDTVLPDVSQHILRSTSQGEKISTIHLEVADDEIVYRVDMLATQGSEA